MTDKVTLEGIKAKIKTVGFMRIPGSTVTICHIELQNGFSVRGESACVDPEAYNQALVEKLAQDDAIRKIWPLEGYLLAEGLYNFRCFQAFQANPDKMTPENQGVVQ